MIHESSMISFRKPLGLAAFLFGLFALVTVPGVIAGTKDEEAKKYTEQLQKSKDAKTRAEAIRKIGELAQINKKLGEAAVGDIKKALTDKDKSVRVEAALAFGRCDPDDSDAVETLHNVLKNDKEEAVKVNAALGLKAMGTKAKDALPTLNALAKEAPKGESKKAYQAAAKSISETKKK